MKPVLPKTADRCMGHCCEDFVLLLGGEARTMERARTWIAEAKAGGPLTEEDLADLEAFLERLVPSGCGDEKHFTCKCFDQVERRCSKYESRPVVCREYGTAAVPCQHPDCQWEDAARTLVSSYPAQA